MLMSNFENRLAEPQSELAVQTMKGHRIILNDFLNLIKKKTLQEYLMQAAGGQVCL